MATTVHKCKTTTNMKRFKIRYEERQVIGNDSKNHETTGREKTIEVIVESPVTTKACAKALRDNTPPRSGSFFWRLKEHDYIITDEVCTFECIHGWHDHRPPTRYEDRAVFGTGRHNPCPECGATKDSTLITNVTFRERKDITWAEAQKLLKAQGTEIKDAHEQ